MRVVSIGILGLTSEVIWAIKVDSYFSATHIVPFVCVIYPRGLLAQNNGDTNVFVVLVVVCHVHQVERVERYSCTAPATVDAHV